MATRSPWQPTRPKSATTRAGVNSLERPEITGRYSADLAAIHQIQQAFAGEVSTRGSGSHSPWAIKLAHTFPTQQAHCHQEGSSRESSIHNADIEEAVGSDEEYAPPPQCISEVQTKGYKLIAASNLPDATAAATMHGCGRGVPPSSAIEHCVVVTLRRGRPPFAVTCASDGWNWVWDPGAGWEHRGCVPFASVYSEFSRSKIRTRSMPPRRGAPPAMRTARTQVQREAAEAAEALQREQQAHEAQAMHLDPDRERFIKDQMRTTVLRELDLQVVRRAQDGLEAYQRLAEKCGCTTSDASIPGTPRGVLQMVRRQVARANRAEKRSTSGASAKEASMRFRDGDAGVNHQRPTSVSSSGGNAHAKVLRLTCAAAHPELPRLAAGIGDGQIAVYHLYRAHGQRRPQLHQTQGFDASQGCADVATALHVPRGPLEPEGALRQEVVIAGFESGRVAVFRVVTMEELGYGGAIGEGEPTPRALKSGKPQLSTKEPLLVQHTNCKGPVASVLWHPILGIVAVCSNGNVVITDSSGAVTTSIPDAAGHNASIASVDLARDLDQLAVAGQRMIHLWQCMSNSRAGVLDPTAAHKPFSPVLLVRYLPSQRFLLSAHERDGIVLVWDVLRLEIHRSLQAVECPRATCAVWDENSSMVLVFGHLGVSQLDLTLEDAPKAQARRLNLLLTSAAEQRQKRAREMEAKWLVAARMKMKVEKLRRKNA